MLRRSALCAVLSLAAVAPAFATEVHDSAGRYTAVVPDGWTRIENLKPPGALLLKKTTSDGATSVCGVAIAANPATSSRTQKEIDEELSKALTPDIVKAIYEAQGFKDVVVEKQSKRDGNGHVVFQTVLTVAVATSKGDSPRLKIFEEMHALPGQSHDLGCMTKPENYAAVEAEFVQIGKGYRPETTLVAWNATPSVTLFADAGYRGASRPLSTDTPDVMRLGWNGQTGSLWLSDLSSWQVCEGANYTGRCMVLGASLPGRTSQPFRVGSLHRLNAAQPSGPSRSATGQGARSAATIMVTP